MTEDATRGEVELATGPVERHTDLAVPVGEETVAANRYDPPDGPTPGPALLMYIPYHKDDFITYGAYDPLLEYLARSGYHVVVADIVGTGASTGTKAEPLEPSEGPAGAEIVEWIADREWCDGSVGMVGKSYGGHTALKVAAENPPSLEAIVPIHAPYTGFRDITEAGTFAFHSMGGFWTPLMQALQAMPPTRRAPGAGDDDSGTAQGAWTDVWRERLDGLREFDPWLFQFLDHDTKDSYWADRDIAVEDIRVPTFGISGWRDGYPATTVEYAEAVDAPTRVLLGPWRHVMPHRGRESAIDFRPQVVAWFDRFLKGEEMAARGHDPIEFWTETDGGGRIDGGVWRGTDAWPRVGETRVVSATHVGGGGDDGAPSDDAGDTLSWALTPELDGLVRGERYGPDDDPLDVEYTVDHTVGVDSYDQGRPTDTTPDDNRSLTFETSPFEEPVEVTGNGRIRLRLLSSTPDPVVSVRVVDVAPDGTGRLVSHAELQGSRLAGVDDPDPLVPDEEYTFSLPLKPTSHVFEAGHRLRVAVSGAWFPAICPTPAPDGGPETLTVRSTPDDPSTVTFPGRIHDATVTFDDSVTMGDPETDIVPATSRAIKDGEESWSVEREHHEDRATVESTARQTVELARARMEYVETIEATVVADTPDSAVVRRTTDIDLRYPTETVSIRGTNRVTNETAQARTVITADDQTVFDETWTTLGNGDGGGE